MWLFVLDGEIMKVCRRKPDNFLETQWTGENYEEIAECQTIKDSTWRALFAGTALVLVLMIIYGVFTGKKDMPEVTIMMFLCYIISLLHRPK